MVEAPLLAEPMVQAGLSESRTIQFMREGIFTCRAMLTLTEHATRCVRILDTTVTLVVMEEGLLLLCSFFILGEVVEKLYEGFVGIVQDLIGIDDGG